MFWKYARAERRITFVTASLWIKDTWVEVGIGNVSTTGLMVKCTNPPPVGTAVEIRKRGQVITGKVVWTIEARFGLQADAPIDAKALLSRSGLQIDRRNAAREGPDRRAVPRWWWQQSR